MPDGSWGSPQRTAWNVIALSLHQPEEESLTRAARYLSETQRGDGSWLPELWATITESRRNSSSDGRTVSRSGASISSSSEIPVSRRTKAGTGWPGFAGGLAAGLRVRG